jgi:hypothetical protein
VVTFRNRLPPPSTEKGVMCVMPSLVWTLSARETSLFSPEFELRLLACPAHSTSHYTDWAGSLLAAILLLNFCWYCLLGGGVFGINGWDHIYVAEIAARTEAWKLQYRDSNPRTIHQNTFLILWEIRVYNHMRFFIQYVPLFTHSTRRNSNTKYATIVSVWHDSVWLTILPAWSQSLAREGGGRRCPPPTLEFWRKKRILNINNKKLKPLFLRKV